MSVLEDLTVETFRGRVGETFHLETGDGRRLELGLATLTEHQLGGPPPGVDVRRVPFSLEFWTAARLVLPQRIYAIRHAELGVMELFLVPIGPDPQQGGMRYEAVFT